jgi:hypothetical protein
LEKSISSLNALSDHGIHRRDGSPTNEFWAGEYEHRNPALFVIVPEAYVGNAALMGNLLHNRGRMVSHLDTYRTLRDLAAPETLGRAAAAAEGRSLLSHRIPADRTCRDAGIREKWCNCWARLGDPA